MYQHNYLLKGIYKKKRKYVYIIYTVYINIFEWDVKEVFLPFGADFMEFYK